MSTTSEPRRPRGLRLHDLIGLVVGYGMAALLIRSFWRRSSPIAGSAAAAIIFEFSWLGLAMSGPVLLLLDRRGGMSTPLKPLRPPKPGRLISTVKPVEPPVGQGPARSLTPQPSRYTRAETAWLMIGAYWIALTMFVVPALSVDTPWALAGLLQIVVAVGLWVMVPRRTNAGTTTNAWTHYAALGLLWTWPFAWMFMILLSRGF